MTDTVRSLSSLQTLLADNTAGDISPQDARDVLVSAWTPEWVRYLNHRLPSETAHADDDFFDDGSKAGTEQLVSGSATWTEKYGLLSVKYQGQSTGDAAAYLNALTPSSAPVTIETAVRFHFTAVTGYPALALCFTDGISASANHAAVAVYYDTGWWFQQRAGTLTAMAADVGNALVDLADRGFRSRLYLRLIWTAANTFKTAMSLDGDNWSNVGGTSFSKTMTPTHFGVFVSYAGSDQDKLASFDYLRVYESDLSV